MLATHGGKLKRIHAMTGIPWQQASGPLARASPGAGLRGVVLEEPGIDEFKQLGIEVPSEFDIVERHPGFPTLRVDYRPLPQHQRVVVEREGEAAVVWRACAEQRHLKLARWSLQRRHRHVARQGHFVRQKNAERRLADGDVAGLV